MYIFVCLVFIISGVILLILVYGKVCRVLSKSVLDPNCVYVVLTSGVNVLV